MYKQNPLILFYSIRQENHTITALNCSYYNLAVEVRAAACGFLKNKRIKGFCFYILRIYGNTACIASKPESS